MTALTGEWLVERYKYGECRFDLCALPYKAVHAAPLCNCCADPEMATHRLTVWIGATGVEFYICGTNAALMLREED